MDLDKAGHAPLVSSSRTLKTVFTEKDMSVLLSNIKDTKVNAF